MPSYFFHIALDLHQAPSPSADPLAQALKPFRIPFRTTVKQSPPQLAVERTQTAASAGTDNSAKEKEPVVRPTALNLPSDANLLWPGGSEEGRVAGGSAALSAADDWRYDKISVRGIDMARLEAIDKHDGNGEITRQMSNSLAAAPGGLATKGRYEPSEPQGQDLGWGIVRLYRDEEETPGLYDDASSSSNILKSSRNLLNQHEERPRFRDEDCTTLCILAVPSYLTPSDFLGFVGEKTREEVSHFRMIRTERSNRYMVLMKFRHGKKAREWRKEWNGKSFDGMEVCIITTQESHRDILIRSKPENCHVVFVKSIELRIRQKDGQEPTFPDMTHDPFTPSPPGAEKSSAGSTTVQTSLASTSRIMRPKAPPTPALIELPTCPVCLERMDESTGLLTILCQHVFHCSCLQKWKGSGCPVCRYTQNDLGRRHHGTGEEPGLNECSICRSDANLWVCLICGHVGCGRYDAAHAFAHYEQSSHCFAMELNTQRVWDYARDGYVHRIMQTKPDGKLVELPPTPTHTIVSAADDFDDYVPREKLDNIGLEYTHLLTSQLDSQRMYFEEILERAADKTSQAARAAEKANEAASLVAQQFASLQLAHDNLVQDTIPALEREHERAKRKAEKFEGMARKLEKEWREEKAMGGSLLEKVQRLSGEVEALKGEKMELEEQNRDLGFFISGGEKLKEGLQGSSRDVISEEEVREGTVSLPEVPPPSSGRNGKKKGGKGKKS